MNKENEMNNVTDKSDEIRHNEDIMNMKLLNMNEVCALLGVSKTTLYKLIHNRKIKAKGIESRTVFLMSDIREYINSLEEKEWLYE